MAQSILLVDDDTPIRELYEQILTGAGYAVDSAEDGKKGLAKIKEKKYDLILLDIMMPQIDGIGVLDTIKSENIKNGPIIFMTNLLNDPATKEVVEKGAAGVITKVNLAPDQFLAAVGQVLGQK
jgi:CheY-like chemotaxis protein